MKNKNRTLGLIFIAASFLSFILGGYLLCIHKSYYSPGYVGDNIENFIFGIGFLSFVSGGITTGIVAYIFYLIEKRKT